MLRDRLNIDLARLGDAAFLKRRPRAWELLA
jgi:hypothetical protein